MSIKNKILLSISIFTGIYILTFFVSTNKVHSEALEVLERQTNLLKKEIVSNIDKEKVILANKNREILFKALSDSTEKTARYASQQVDNLFSTALNDLVFLSRNYNGNAVDSFLKNRTSLVNSITIKKASFKNNRWIVDGLVSKKRIPLYKEFTVFNKNGDEVFKIPQTAVKKNIKLKNNTYLNSETYFSNSLSLEPKQHFISKQVGLYVKSSKFKDVTTNDNFKELGFLGLENPLGRKHEGFIRLIYRINNDLFATLLLDSSHLKSILDYINPVDGKTNLMPDASSGNYSFMQDYLGNTITHPRNPFIMGSINGEDVLPWLSEKNYKSIQSGKKLKDLREYVVEDKDSFSKEQLRNGLIPTNCKFLSFAPQCKQWKDIHETKNIGSNIIEWADKKMVSAVSSLEFKHFVKGKESQYGYVIVNRSLSEVNQLIATSFKQINNTLKNSENKLSMIPYEIESKVHKIINEAISSLSIVTFLLIFFILVFSFYILRDFDKRIQFLVSLTNDVFKGKKHSMPKDSTDELSKLESALKQASNDLNTSYTEIKEKEKIILEMEKEKAITELSQDVAHDMRTPIAALNLLTKKLKNSMPYDFYKEIRNISERIQDIANNLLTAKNSPAISEQIEELPLQIVIRRILSEKKRICKNNDIELLFKDRLNYYIKCDLPNSSFARILSNIIDNSIESLSFGGSIKLILDEVDKDRFTLKIHDNGEGFPVDILSKLGSEKITTKADGHGIGIFSAHKTLQDFSSRMYCYNDNGAVTELNLKGSKSKTLFTKTISVYDGEKVLIIEDDPTLRKIYDRLFSKTNVSFKIVSNFIDAFDIKDQFDFFIVDYHIKGTDYTGINFIEKNCLEIRSILCTNHFDSLEIINECNEAGVPILPKTELGRVDVSQKRNIVLVDDEKIIRDYWELELRRRFKVTTYPSIRELLPYLNDFPKETLFFFDSNLREEVGQIESEKVFNQGFKHLYLCTGQTNINLSAYKYLKGIINKEPQEIRRILC